MTQHSAKAKEREDRARIEWLRTAAKEAFDSLDRGEGITFQSWDELDAYIRAIGQEVFAEELPISGRSFQKSI